MMAVTEGQRNNIPAGTDTDTPGYTGKRGTTRLGRR